MFSLSSQSRIFIHALPTDMRKSFDALCGIVKGDFQKDIMQGDYFVFFNRVASPTTTRAREKYGWEPQL